MKFNLSTPALLFSAISLLMIAYTNRFLALAALIRQHIQLYKESNDDDILKQVKNFENRLKVIKYTQVFAVVSFLFCVICMVLIFTNRILPAEIVFLISLISLFISLFLSLQEVFLSIGALNIEMKQIKKKRKGSKLN